jgi:hypothetical protein
MLMGGTDDATGIEGLMVNGVTFNVTFVNGSYYNIYTDVGIDPYYYGKLAGANAAAIALSNALTSLKVTGLNGSTTPDAVVPTEYIGSTQSGYGVDCPVNALNFCDTPISWIDYTYQSLIDPDSSYPDFDYTYFTPTAVPSSIIGTGIPGLLFAAGGMFALWPRRRKAQAIAA